MKINEALLDNAKQRQDLLAAALKDGRGFTEAEQAQMDQLEAKGAELVEKKTKADEGQALMARIGAIAPGMEGGDETKTLGLTGQGAKATAQRLLSKMQERRGEAGFTKALVESGSTTTVEALDLGVRVTQRVASSLLELLAVNQHSTPTFSYLRQTTRTNNAAIVAPGAAKPTSVYSVARVDSSLQVFAHMSEAIDKYLLADNANLVRFVASELAYGLGTEVEAEVLSGAGTTGHLTGILNTSGVQTQAFGDDAITTLRSAATKLETLGFSVGAYVVNPTDWESMETARNTSGNFDLNGPVDRAGQTVWGKRVVTSNGLTAGTALAVDLSALAVDTDTQGVEIAWSDAVNDDFQKNQIRCRTEGRFGLSVYQPAGIVIATIAGV